MAILLPALAFLCVILAAPIILPGTVVVGFALLVTKGYTVKPAGRA